MKHQTNITIDEEIILKVKDLLKDKAFKNQSHIFEFAIKKLIKEKKDA